MKKTSIIKYIYSKKIFGLLICLIFPVATATAQINNYALNDSIQARIDIADIIFGAKRDSLFKSSNSDKKVFFSLIPISGGSSEPGVAVSAINIAFYLGDPENTNLSNLLFYPTTNFSSYIQFKAIPNLWMSGNAWNIPGKIEVATVTQDNYGLGANTIEDSLFTIDYQLYRLYLDVNKSVVKNFFLGVGYNLDNFFNVEAYSDSTTDSYFDPYAFGIQEKTVSSGITLNFLFDSRKNSNNPLDGIYTKFAFRFNEKWLGSDYRWQSLYFDTRKYINLSKVRHRTIALWGLYWATFGDVPYLNLPGTGLDYNAWTGRGYSKGRFRGTQMLYAEAEYRFDLTKSGLWGAVLFTNFQSYTEPEDNRFRYIAPAVGTGLRLKFNKYSDSNITFDIAVGKQSYNWYFSLNEVF